MSSTNTTRTHNRSASHKSLDSNETKDKDNQSVEPKINQATSKESKVRKSNAQALQKKFKSLLSRLSSLDAGQALINAYDIIYESRKNGVSLPESTDFQTLEGLVKSLLRLYRAIEELASSSNTAREKKIAKDKIVSPENFDINYNNIYEHNFETLFEHKGEKRELSSGILQQIVLKLNEPGFVLAPIDCYLKGFLGELAAASFSALGDISELVDSANKLLAPPQTEDKPKRKYRRKSEKSPEITKLVEEVEVESTNKSKENQKNEMEIEKDSDKKKKLTKKEKQKLEEEEKAKRLEDEEKAARKGEEKELDQAQETTEKENKDKKAKKGRKPKNPPTEIQAESANNDKIPEDIKPEVNKEEMPTLEAKPAKRKYKKRSPKENSTPADSKINEVPEKDIASPMEEEPAENPAKKAKQKKIKKGDLGENTNIQPEINTEGFDLIMDLEDTQDKNNSEEITEQKDQPESKEPQKKKRGPYKKKNQQAQQMAIPVELVLDLSNPELTNEIPSDQAEMKPTSPMATKSREEQTSSTSASGSKSKKGLKGVSKEDVKSYEDFRKTEEIEIKLAQLGDKTMKQFLEETLDKLRKFEGTLKDAVKPKRVLTYKDEITKQIAWLEWMKSALILYVRKTNKDEVLRDLYERALDVAIPKNFKTFLDLEEKYDKTKYYLFKLRAFLKKLEETHNKVTDNLEIPSSKAHVSPIDKQSFLEAKGMLEIVNENGGPATETEEHLQLREMVKECEEYQQRKVELMKKISKYLHVKDETHLELFKSKNVLINDGLESLRKILNGLPLRMEREEQELDRAEWEAETLCFLNGMITGDLHYCRGLIQRGIGLERKNSFIFDRLANQISLNEKIQGACQELRDRECIAKHLIGTSRKMLMTLEQLEQLKEEMTKSLFDNTNELNYVNELLNRAQKFREQITAWVGPQEGRKGLDLFEKLLEDIRELPFQVTDDEEALEKLIENCKKIAEEYEKSDLKGQKLVETLKNYRNQPILFPEMEKMLRIYQTGKEKSDLAEEELKDTNIQYSKLKEIEALLRDINPELFPETLKELRTSIFLKKTHLLLKIWQRKSKNYLVRMCPREFLEIEAEGQRLLALCGDGVQGLTRMLKFVQEVKQSLNEKLEEVNFKLSHENLVQMLNDPKLKFFYFVDLTTEIQTSLCDRYNLLQYFTFELEAQRNSSFSEFTDNFTLYPEDRKEESAQKRRKLKKTSEMEEEFQTPALMDEGELSNSSQQYPESKRRFTNLLRNALNQNSKFNLVKNKRDDIVKSITDYVEKFSDGRFGNSFENTFINFFNKLRDLPSLSLKLQRERFSLDYINSLRMKSDAFLEELERKEDVREKDKDQDWSDELRKKLKKTVESGVDLLRKKNELSAEKRDMSRKTWQAIQKRREKEQREVRGIVDRTNSSREKINTQKILEGTLTTSLLPFTTQISFVTKKVEEDVQFLLKSVNSDLKIKGYLPHSSFADYFDKVIKTSRAPNHPTDIICGWVTSNFHQTKLDEYAQDHRFQKKFSVIHMGDNFRVYLFHTAQLLHSWRQELNHNEIYHDSDNPSDLAFIMTFKRASPVKYVSSKEITTDQSFESLLKMFKTQLEIDYEAASRILRQSAQVPNVPIELLEIMKNLLEAKEKEEIFKRGSSVDFGFPSRGTKNNFGGNSTPFNKVYSGSNTPKWKQYQNTNSGFNNKPIGRVPFYKNPAQNNNFKTSIRNPFLQSQKSQQHQPHYLQRRGSDNYSGNQDNYGDIDYSKTGLHDLDLDDFRTETSFQDSENHYISKPNIQKTAFKPEGMSIEPREYQRPSSVGKLGYNSQPQQQQKLNNGYAGYSNENGNQGGAPRNSIRKAFQERMIQEKRETPMNNSKGLGGGFHQPSGGFFKKQNNYGNYSYGVQTPGRINKEANYNSPKQMYFDEEDHNIRFNYSTGAGGERRGSQSYREKGRDTPMSLGYRQMFSYDDI